MDIADCEYETMYVVVYSFVGPTLLPKQSIKEVVQQENNEDSTLGQEDSS